MSRVRTLGWWTGFFAASVLLVFTGTASAQNYKLIRRIPVGAEGGWDYIKVDADAQRLYVARGDHMMIVDEVSGKVLGDIPNTKGIHGTAIADTLGKGYTSNGQAGTVTVFDLKTLKPITDIKTTGDNPDSIIYDPATKRVFTMNARSNNSSVIDATTDRVVGTVDLGGKPEEPALDGRGNMFVNLTDSSMIMSFDTKTLAKKGPWSLAPCEGPSALSADTKNRRLFAACDKMIAVMNMDTGKVVATPAIGGDPDGNGFDPGTGLIFATSREGLLTVIHEDTADKYTIIGNVNTQFGARTMTLDPKTHHVFTETADFKPAAAPTPDNPRPRPQAIPNSFVILELGPQ
jgi:YVTN family beta-propeller protein